MRDLNLSSEIFENRSKKGRETLRQILLAARDVFMDSGYGAFSLQKVADTCGLSRGNVSYYFPTTDILMHELLQAVVKGYVDDLEKVSSRPDLTAEQKFVAIVEMLITDLGTPETSFFFPELWALSNHNKDAMKEMTMVYSQARAHIVGLLGQINPKLDPTERDMVGLFISASIEGQTPFVGYAKEWHSYMPSIINIAAYSFLNLAKTIGSADIATLTVPAKAPGQ